MTRTKLLLPLLLLTLLPHSAVAASPELDLKTSIQQLQQAFLWIEHFYVDSVDCEQMSADAIRGILKELDPHSTFLTPEEVKKANEPLDGNFEGIGIRYQMDEDTLFVINTIIGGPSERAGILAGDRIVRVNDTVIAGVKMTTDEIQRRLRGPKGTHVRVEVKRTGEGVLIPFDLKRDKIPVYSVDASFMVTPEVGYVKVSRFARTTHEELEKAFRTLKAKGMKHVIIDLQGNGGGYLESAVDMAEDFLHANDLIVYTEGRVEKRKEYRVRDTGSLADGRVVVLIDEQSASASEIFSGAMQDLDRGVVVGRRSFGKGLVQRPVPLPGGAMIRLTIAHYYTPSGRCIQKPYTKGAKEDYYKDLGNRRRHGEMLSADSIHFADSLRCRTVGGRTVYGGGGIMPDLFVPLDTTRTTRTHRDIIARGTYARYILSYFDENQQRLHTAYPDLDSYAEGFEVTDDMIEDLCHRAEADSIRVDSADIAACRTLLKAQVKASIGSDLFDTGAYYRIINDRNDIYRRGVEIITDERRYNDLLQGRTEK